MPTEEKILTTEEIEVLSAPLQEQTVPEERSVPQETNHDYSTHLQETQEALEARDRSILAALDEMLARNSTPPPKKPPEDNGIEKFCLGMVRKGAGIISLSLILIFMGIVLITCLFSPEPDYLLPLKLSPVAAVLIGLELLVYHLASGRKFRIHIPAIVISAVIVVGCCMMAVTLNGSYNQSKEEYNNRTVAAQIYESGYHELRHAADIEQVDVEVELNPSGAANKSGIEALSADDLVVITVTFGGSYNTPAAFATECKTVVDGYRFLGVPVTEFHFISDTKFHSFRLDVDGLYMQDYSVDRLAQKVSHVYIEDFDYIDDLEDFVVETEETSETKETIF